MASKSNRSSNGRSRASSATRSPRPTRTGTRSRKAALAELTGDLVPATARIPVEPPVIELTHEQIAARAYQVWERKGRPIGLDVENWREAEAELRAELTLQRV